MPSITMIKNHIRDYLTECPVKLSSKNFEFELIEFLEEHGIHNVSHINVSELNVAIILTINECTTARIIVSKEIFE